MDKDTIKSIVIESRDSGMTYQKIADMLKNKYGVIKTRQSLQSLYSRATNKNNIERNSDYLFVTTDVINYYSLGLGVNAILGIINDTRTDRITTYQINEILRCKEKQLKNIENSQIDKIINVINNLGTIEQINHTLEYKGVKPKESRVESLIAKACSKMIKQSAIETISKIINVTGDTSIIGKMNGKHSLEITLKETNKAVNNSSVAG